MLGHNMRKRGGLSRLNRQILTGVLCITALVYVIFSGVVTTSEYAKNPPTASRSHITLDSPDSQGGLHSKSNPGRTNFIVPKSKTVAGSASSALAAGEGDVVSGIRTIPQVSTREKEEDKTGGTKYLNKDKTGGAKYLKKKGEAETSPVEPPAAPAAPGAPAASRTTTTTVEESIPGGGVKKTVTVVEQPVALAPPPAEPYGADTHLITVAAKTQRAAAMQAPGKGPSDEHEKSHSQDENVVEEEDAEEEEDTTSNTSSSSSTRSVISNSVTTDTTQEESETSSAKEKVPAPKITLLSCAAFAAFFGAFTARNIRRKGLLRDCIENEVYDDARYQHLEGEDFSGDYPPVYGAAGGELSYEQSQSGFERVMSYGSSSFRGGLGVPRKGERFDV